MTTNVWLSQVKVCCLLTELYVMSVFECLYVLHNVPVNIHVCSVHVDVYTTSLISALCRSGMTTDLHGILTNMRGLKNYESHLNSSGFLILYSTTSKSKQLS